MAVTQNLKGTSYPSFKIHKSGPTLFQGDVSPSFSATHGDLYLQTGTEGALWLYDNNAWGQLGAGGTSTDTTIITNSTNTGSYVQQYVLHGETTDGSEHILAPTSAFSIDTTNTTLDNATLTIDTGSVSGVIPVPLNSAGLFEVRIVARSANPNNNAGYTLKGVIVNDAGTTTLINETVESILAESLTEWYALVEANDNGNDSFVIKVSGSSNTTVRWTAFVTLTLVATPAYTITASSNAINEGDSVTFTLATTHMTDGSTIAYTITGIDQADLSSGSLTGNFTVTNNTATQSFTLANDATTEGTENMTLALNNGLASADVVVITDTSLDPTYTLTSDNNTINEGNTVTYTLTTTNVPDSTNVAYTVTGIDSNDLSVGSLTGNFTITSNTATATFTLAEDVTTEGQEVMTLTLDNGGDALDVVITDTSLNAPSTPSGYQTPQNLAPASSGGTTTKFIGEQDYSISSNDNFAIITEARASAYDSGTYVKNIGWCYLLDMNTATVVKSWNPLLDGDHSDDGSLASWTPGGSFTQSSKYHTAYCGRSTAINSEYAFLSATFESYNQVAGAYVFVYKLSDYSIAKVFRLADIPNVMPDDGNGASANTDYGYYGLHATENWLAVGARRVSTPGGSTNNPATSEQEGAMFIYDISDANPANWSFVKHLENPVPNSARTVGPAQWWAFFGSVMHISDTGNYMYTNHGGRSYKYSLTNNTWASNPVTMWGADPFSNTNYNPTDLNDVYFDQDHSKLDGNILYWADTSGDVVKAYNLDTETLLWTSATYDTPRSIDLSSDKVFVQAEENSQYKIYTLNKSDGTLAETFTSPNHGTGVAGFGRHFGVTSDGKLIAAEQDTNNEYSYMLLFKPTANSNYVENDYVLIDYISQGGGGGGGAVWYGDRAVYTGNIQSGTGDDIGQFDIATLGNATGFGGLISNHEDGGHSALSNGTKALFAGGPRSASRTDDIEIITISTPANATDFGNLLSPNSVMDAIHSGSYGFIAGGDVAVGQTDVIQTVVVDTPGNATSFGTLDEGDFQNGIVTDNSRIVRGGKGTTFYSLSYWSNVSMTTASDFGDFAGGDRAAANAVGAGDRGIFMGGTVGDYTSMEYISIQTPGNAVAFGNLLTNQLNNNGYGEYFSGSANNATRGTKFGGVTNGGSNEIQYITMDTLGDGQDFGDLQYRSSYTCGTSGNAS